MKGESARRTKREFLALGPGIAILQRAVVGMRPRHRQRPHPQRANPAEENCGLDRLNVLAGAHSFAFMPRVRLARAQPRKAIRSRWFGSYCLDL